MDGQVNKVKPAYSDGFIELYQGDVLERLRGLESDSVQTCVTSPPYYGLRNYGTGQWVGGVDGHDHKGDERFYTEQTASVSSTGAFASAGSANVERLKAARWREAGVCECGARYVDQQIGLEASPLEYIDRLVEVFEEVRRVLKPDGTCWVNLGDSYNSIGHKKSHSGFGTSTLAGGEQTHSPLRRENTFPGLKHKDLIGVPWRVAFALQAAGWWLRQDIIWAKPNPMPESVTDRCTKSHEYIFLLTKSAKYFYNHEVIKEPLKDVSAARLIRGVSDSHKNINEAPGQTPHSLAQPRDNQRKAVRFGGNKYGDSDESGRTYSGNEWNPKGRDRTNGNRNGLGASTLDKKAFDPSQAGGGAGVNGHSGYFKEDGTPLCGVMANKKSVWTVTTHPFKEAHFATFPEKLIEPCILAGSREGDTVLDPFNGAGTTGLVALKHKRNYIGLELNPEYIEITKRRLAEIQVKLF